MFLILINSATLAHHLSNNIKISDVFFIPLVLRFQKAKYEKYFKKAVVYPEAGFDLSHFPWKYGMDWRNEAPLVVVQIELDQENFNKDGLEARIVCSVQAALVSC